MLHCKSEKNHIAFNFSSNKYFSCVIVYFVFIFSGSSYVSNGMFGVSGQNVLPATALPLPLKPEPYIDQITPKNVTALVGKSAYLSCRVRNLANKTVRT